MAGADAELNVGANGEAFSNEMKKMAKDVDTMANSVTARLARLRQAFKAVTGFTSTIFSIPGAIKDAVGAMMAPAAANERLALSFEVLLGSETKAIQLMAELNAYAEETPFYIEEISNAAKVMLANTDMSAEEVMVRVKQLGDIAAMSGQSMEDLAGLYARAVNLGVNSQIAKSFETAGVGIRKSIADLQGITVKDVAEKISEGTVSIVHLNAALDSMVGSGGKFEKGAQRLSQTFEGLASTIGGKINAAIVNFTNPLLDQVEPVMQKIIEAFTEAMPAIERLGIMFGDWIGDKVQNSVLPALDDLILQIPELGVQFEYLMNKAQDFLDFILAIPNAIKSAWDAYMGFAQQVADWLTYEDMTWEQAGKHAQRVRKNNSSEGKRDNRLAELRKVRKEQLAAAEDRRQQRLREAQEREEARASERAATEEQRRKDNEERARQMAADEAHTKELEKQKKLTEDNAKAAEKYADAMERYDIERAKKKYDKLSIPQQEKSLRRQAKEAGVKGTLSPENIRQRMDELAAAGAETNKKEIASLQRMLEAWDALVERKKDYAHSQDEDRRNLQADALEAAGNDHAARKIREKLELEKRIRDLRAEGATKEEATLQATMEAKVKQANELQERLQNARVEFIQGHLASVGGGGASIRLGGATLAESKKHSRLLKEIGGYVRQLTTRKSSNTAVLA